MVARLLVLNANVYVMPKVSTADIPTSMYQTTEKGAVPPYSRGLAIIENYGIQDITGF